MTPDPHYADEQAREHDEHLAEQDAREREQDRLEEKGPARLPNHDERMRVAESVAGWYLGHPSWAGLIVGSYLNPESARAALRREKGE